jgi:hypothetical protein
LNGRLVAQARDRGHDARELRRHHGGCGRRLVLDAALGIAVDRGAERGGDLRVGATHRDHQVVRVHVRDREALGLKERDDLRNAARRLAELRGEAGRRQELAEAGAGRIGQALDQRFQRRGIAHGQTDGQGLHVGRRRHAQILHGGLQERLDSGRRCLSRLCGAERQDSGQGQRREADRGAQPPKVQFWHGIQLFCLKRRWIEPGSNTGYGFATVGNCDSQMKGCNRLTLPAQNCTKNHDSPKN